MEQKLQLHCWHWFYTKRLKEKKEKQLLSLEGSQCFSWLRTLVWGTRRILTATWAQTQVKNGVWSISFLISLGEFLFELRQQCLILLIKKLCLLSQSLVLFHYVTVLQVQLWVQPLHWSNFPALNLKPENDCYCLILWSKESKGVVDSQEEEEENI